MISHTLYARAQHHGKRLAKEGHNHVSQDCVGRLARHEGCFSVQQTSEFGEVLREAHADECAVQRYRSVSRSVSQPSLLDFAGSGVSGPAVALVYSRAQGYVDASPGLVCVLRCVGQMIRVRVHSVVRPGRVAVRWADDMPPRPSGWERWRKPVVRAGRLQVLDY